MLAAFAPYASESENDDDDSNNSTNDDKNDSMKRFYRGSLLRAGPNDTRYRMIIDME